MIHFTFEGSFLYLSTFGRQVITSTGPFATLCKLYQNQYHYAHLSLP